MFGTHANNFFAKDIDTLTQGEKDLRAQMLQFEDGEIKRITQEQEALDQEQAQTEPETIEEELDPLALDRVTTEAIANSKDGLISDDMKQQIEKLSVDHPKEFLKIFFPDEAGTPEQLNKALVDKRQLFDDLRNREPPTTEELNIKDEVNEAIEIKEGLEGVRIYRKRGDRHTRKRINR
jgi:hypothetical protein